MDLIKKMVCAITRSAARPLSKSPKLLELLSSHFQIDFFQIQQDFSNLNILGPRSAYLIFDSDPEWISKLAREIRSTPQSDISTSALIWVRTAGGAPWSDTEIDDVISGKEDFQSILDRLNVRISQALNRKIGKIRHLENAKNETILKQREEFLSVCAHDLRSPIGIIMASLKMSLVEPNALTALQKDLLGRAQRQSEHALTMVEDLLDVMAYEQGLRPEYQVVNVGTFFDEFHRDYRVVAEQKTIQFFYENRVQDWNVLMDPDRIRQLMQNIFTNAVKFTEPGKSISLVVDQFQGRRKTDPPYPMVIVSLRDEGKGIAQKDLSQIFNRFSQVKGAGRADGRGLGLTVAKQIAQLHKGNVWATSREGEGSIFFALFPHVLSQATPSSRTQKIILVADPAVENRELYQSALIAADVQFVADGVEAIAMANFLQPEIIYFAPRLENISAVDAARIVKAKHCTAKRILVVSNSKNATFDTTAFDGIVQLPLTPKDVA